MLAGSDLTSQLRNRHKAGWAICAPVPMDHDVLPGWLRNDYILSS